MKKLLLIAVFGAVSLFAADGATLYSKCASCHGAKGEVAAMGKSEPIAGWDTQKTIDALKGYKDGSYGKALKGLMKSQVANLSDEDMKVLAEYIKTLK